MLPRPIAPIFQVACLALGALSTLACSGGDEPCKGSCGGGGSGGGGGAPGTTVLMDFAGKGGFYASPFPSDARLTADGRPDMTGFPNPKSMDLVKQVLAILNEDTKGFGTTSAIYLRTSAPLDPAALPDLHGSVQEGSKVALVDVTTGSPDYLRRHPISIRFATDGGLYGDPNLLSLLPLQGIPLRAGTRYAAIVLRSLGDADGKELAQSPAMADLAAGRVPEGMSQGAGDAYAAALAALDEAGIRADDLAGLAVFTTGEPTGAMEKVTDAMLAGPTPTPTNSFVLGEVFDDYCVYSTTIPMPEYQGGEPPYTSAGGEWVFDENGSPVLQRMEEANFVVTVPRRAMPAAGFPIVVFSRTGGGGERPLVDRGAQATNGGPAITPGTGPAFHFAKAGFAGSSIDGPHGGLRNVTHGDEQFLMFNIGNPRALRDNVRQSAAELVLQAHILKEVSIDVAGCPGVVAPGGKASFDTGTAALMGHSMGATIAPLSLAFEPKFRAGLLSGAGGSWIENVIHKQKPLAVKGIAEVLVGIAGTGAELTEHDPVLSMFQWAGEAADPPVYAARIVPRHILMMQGIVDHYIMPPIADAASLSLGLDLAGPALDEETPEVASLAPLGPLLDLAGRRAIALPASGNVGGAVTAVVTQHAEDGIEDGHEVVFQTEAPKHEYRCFLEGLAKGLPVVPGPGGALDPCE